MAMTSAELPAGALPTRQPSSSGLLPFSTVISRAAPDDDLIGQYQYRPNFLSSDLPSEADDEFLTPRPASRGLKRDLAAYSSDNEDISYSQASNPAAKHWHKRRHANRSPYTPSSSQDNNATLKRRLPAINFQIEGVRAVINAAIEESQTTIHLGSRNLTYLPEEIGDLRHITSLTPSRGMLQLFLEKNRLTSLPESLFSINNLEFLGLSGNRLKSLSPSISKLSNLKSLNVGLNNIDYLPASLLTMTSLEHLVFHSVVIQSSPARRSGSSMSLSMSSSNGVSTQTTDPPTRPAPVLEDHPRTIFPNAVRPHAGHGGVASLTELCLRYLAEDSRWRQYVGTSEDEMTDDEAFASVCGPRLLDLVKSPTRCDGCGVLMCQVYALREELWSNFAGTEGLPIRRILCSHACLTHSPTYVP
ncbi:hypothetical protein PYCC9005_005729 [Savitreella phatthalungensis]